MQRWDEPFEDDPLGVLSSTRVIVRDARLVRIDLEAIDRQATVLASGTLPPTGTVPPTDWAAHHFADRSDLGALAGWVLALDALNFCFWSDDPDPNRRWKVRRPDGELVDGYWALVAALRRAVESGTPVWDPAWLCTLSEADAAMLLAPAEPGMPAIPLFRERVENLRELGQVLSRQGTGSAAALRYIEQAGGSAVRLVQQVVSDLPSFNDVAVHEGREIRFYKRAQILVADLGTAFGGTGLAAFGDLDLLTAFADYKVPQVMRELGLLVYHPDLAETISSRTPVPAGSREEIEIRAATIWGCELLRRALADRGTARRATEIDWLLWEAGQSCGVAARPYHRTLTLFY